MVALTPLRKLSRRERLFSVITITAVLAASAYVWIIEPVTVNCLSVYRRACEAEVELAKLTALVEQRSAIEAEYKQLKGAISSGKSEQELKLALMTEVDKLAGASGLMVTSVRPTLVKRQKEFYRYGVELQARCEGHKLAAFLYAMQERERLLYAEQVTIVAGREQPPLTVTLQISKLAKLEP